MATRARRTEAHAAPKVLISHPTTESAQPPAAGRLELAAADRPIEQSGRPPPGFMPDGSCGRSRRDECVRGEAIPRPSRVARMLAVETGHAVDRRGAPETAAKRPRRRRCRFRRDPAVPTVALGPVIGSGASPAPFFATGMSGVMLTALQRSASTARGHRADVAGLSVVLVARSGQGSEAGLAPALPRGVPSAPACVSASRSGRRRQSERKCGLATTRQLREQGQRAPPVALATCTCRAVRREHRPREPKLVTAGTFTRSVRRDSAWLALALEERRVL
jgi:hypothetical protein